MAGCPKRGINRLGSQKWLSTAQLFTVAHLPLYVASNPLVKMQTPVPTFDLTKVIFRQYNELYTTRRLQEIQFAEITKGENAMQAYGPGFAQVYNKRWTSFARQVAPFLLKFYGDTPLAQSNRFVLDLCCGTGQLALYFLERGYQLVGLDLSPAMLHYARENTQRYLETGQARFVQADATNFTLEERFGLVVSTFDALNHLPDLQALQDCFACVAAVSDGYFVFDLNTRTGLRRWNSIEVDDSREDMTIVNHGIYDMDSTRAWMKVTGFVRNADGLYERFEQTAYNTVFAMQDVQAALLATGWQDVYFAHLQDLKTPLADPEQEGRVFVVARKDMGDL